VSVTTEDQARSERADGAAKAARLESEVTALRIRGGRARVEQQIKIGGAALMVVGVVLIVIGWFRASTAGATQTDEFSYLISGGILGLGVIVVGVAVYLRAWMARQRYWLARIATENREHAEAVTASLARIEVLLGGQPPAERAARDRPGDAGGER
jgi:protein-S-isoprenylcysteine O-methyltransferase Ste14